MTAAPKSDSEWRRHGSVLVACVAGVTLATVHGYSLGVMIGPLEHEFGWTRAQISIGPLILAVMALVGAPLVGVAVDRIGARRIGLFGILFFCAALALLSTATARIATWWLLWVLMSIGAILVLPTIWTSAVNGFFVRNRGLALAITLCGTGLGGAFVPALTNALVEAFGWRGGYRALAAIALVVVLPLVALFFTSTADRQRMAPAAGRPGAAVLPGATARAAFRSARYLKLAGASGIIAIGVTSITANAVPILVSQGFARGNAASIAGLIGIGAIIGRLCGGYLLDRLDANRVAAVSVLMPVATALILLYVPGDPVAAVIALLVLGLAVGTELDACAYLAARHFGLRSFGALFGTINGLLLFGSGVAPLAANIVYDMTGSYRLVLWGTIPASLIAATLFALLGPYPDFDDAEPPDLPA